MKNKAGFIDSDAAKKQHERVQAQIAQLPADQQKTVKAAQKAVQDELDKMNNLLFDDRRYEVDAFLKQNRISGNLRDQFISAIKQTKLGDIFTFDDKSFVRTHHDIILPANKYVRSLEEAIIEQVQFKEVKYVTRVTEVESLATLGFTDLIKLAFKRLFKKGENNG